MIAARVGAVAIEVDADRAPVPAARTASALVGERREVGLLHRLDAHGHRILQQRRRRGLFSERDVPKEPWTSVTRKIWGLAGVSGRATYQP